MKKFNLSIIVALLVFILMSGSVYAQETKTLLGSDTDIGFVWGLDLKTSSIKNDIGTSYDLYGGALFNQSTFLGVAFGLNVTHPKLNQGYIVLLAQYTYKPDNLIHYSGQLLLGAGSAKGYEQKKSSTLDNFGNITGPGFYLIEPGVNVEFNLTKKTRLLIGLSYRYVTGLGDLTFEQEDWESNISKQYTYSDTDLSSLNFNIGVKIGKY